MCQKETTLTCADFKGSRSTCMIHFSLKYVEVLPVSKPPEHQIFHFTGKKHCFTDQVQLKIITYLAIYREETKSGHLSQNQLLSDLDFLMLIPRSLPVQESSEDKPIFRTAFSSGVLRGKIQKQGRGNHKLLKHK